MQDMENHLQNAPGKSWADIASYLPKPKDHPQCEWPDQSPQMQISSTIDVPSPN